MKKTLLLLSFAPLISFAQGICDPNASIIIFSNYDGGTLNINVDDNVPNLRIGVCSYEPITVNLSGAYVENVTSVVWAGYTIVGTSINGVDASVTELQQFPSATLNDPDGYPLIICAYDCDTTWVPGGCNTVDQVTDYFLTLFGGSLRYSYMQYGTWGGSYATSSGGNCCFTTGCTAAVEAGDNLTICAGDSIVFNASGAVAYNWSANGTEINCDAPCEQLTVAPEVSTVYTVTGTDSQGCAGSDVISVLVNDTPDVELTLSGGVLYASGAISYTWWHDGTEIPGITGNTYEPTENGVYWITSTGQNGCAGTSTAIEVEVTHISRLETAQVLLYPNPAKELCTLTFAHASSDRRIAVRDLSGRVLMQLSAIPGSLSVVIPLGHIPAQCLLLVVEEGGISRSLPLVHE